MTTYLRQAKYTFVSAALPEAAFGVVRFHGSEGLSRCYAFEITLVSDDPEVDLAAVVERPASLRIHREGGDDAVFHGIVTGFEQLGSANAATFYRAQLAPRLHWLSMTRHNQVFLNQSVPEFIAACLKDGGLTSLDYELRLQKDYPPLDYVCQYGESHLDFVTRWLEREGMYFFFEQGKSAEKLVITDTHMSHVAMPQGAAIRYAPPSGLETLHLHEIVSAWTCRRSLTPAAIMVKDYNYMKPSLEVSGTAVVDAGGRGLSYIYGGHVQTPEEAGRVAGIYAESERCRRELSHGEGSVPYVCPGFTFALEGHTRSDFNQGYLTLDVDHEGSQTGYLLAGLWPEEERTVFYRNSFTAIPAAVQFRPKRTTPWPKISGAISATVDAAGSGTYAELDAQGRYKVILPFDTSGRKDGKASAWVRMATPYAGAGHGMHFPLHKGTEVLLSFIGGDPDRPVIVAAVPNADTPPVVTGDNQTMAALTTAGGNRIHMEDKAGSERILMHVPKQSSFIRVGAHNDPPATDGDKKSPTTHWGVAEKTDGWLEIQAKSKNEIILGEVSDSVVGLRVFFTFGLRNYVVLGLKTDIHWPAIMTWKNEHFEVTADNFKAYAQYVAFFAARTQFSGVANEVSGTATQAIVNREGGVAARTNIEEGRMRGFAARTNTAAGTIRAQGQLVDAQVSRMKTIGQKLESVGERLMTAGTKVDDAGLELVNTAGPSLRTAGTIIRDAGILTQQAPIIGQQ